MLDTVKTSQSWNSGAVCPEQPRRKALCQRDGTQAKSAPWEAPGLFGGRGPGQRVILKNSLKEEKRTGPKHDAERKILPQATTNNLILARLNDSAQGHPVNDLSAPNTGKTD